MKTIIWSPLSRTQLQSIAEYIAYDNPQAARRIQERVETAVMHLALFPELGRPGTVSNTKELVISGTPYIVPYQVSKDSVLIMGVVHAKQMYPPTK